MERPYWPLVISHCLGDVSWGVTNASSKAGPKDIPGYLAYYLAFLAYVHVECVCVYVCNNNGEAVTRRIPVEPRLGSKTLPQITEPLSYPFVYWSSILGRCNGTWETLTRCPLDWTKEGEGESEIAGQGSRADFGRTIPFSYPRSGR